MSTRPIYLLLFRGSKRERAHFAIYIPNAQNVQQDPDSGCKGTMIHVVGAPMSGFSHEFVRYYDPKQSRTYTRFVLLGNIESSLVTDSKVTQRFTETKALGIIDREALRVDPPRLSQNFNAPVNDTTNRRCQEWTMDYLRWLVRKKYLPQQAVDIAQSYRDPPEHGIGLKPVAQNRARPAGPAQPQSQSQSQSRSEVQSQSQSQSDWVWDQNYKRYRRMVNGQWEWAPSST